MNQNLPSKPKKSPIVTILVILIIVVIGGMVTAIQLAKKKHLSEIETKNRAIQAAAFELRRQTDEYYREKKTYQNWKGNYYLETHIKELGSKLILALPDYQTYVISAQLLESNQIFCLDNKGFVGKLDAAPLKNSCK